MPSTSRTEADDWRRHAACLGGAVDMVPGSAEQVDPCASLDGCAGVLIAKKVCGTCPVTDECLALADQITTDAGPDYTQGVWAGLTLRERDTMRVLGVTPRPCRRCQLLCVPINLRTDVCNACRPRQQVRYDDYQKLITELIEANVPPIQVGERLRLNGDSISSACRRWQVAPPPMARRGRRPVKECGTLAAKTRHWRHGESWRECACRWVPWQTGTKESSSRTSPQEG